MFSPPKLLVFPAYLLIDLFYYLPQGAEPHRSRLPSLSVRFSHHPAEVRHARVTPEGDLFLLLRRSTNSAPRTDHYCSDGAPIVVGVPSSSGLYHPSCDTWLLPLSLTAQTATSGKHHTIVSTHHRPRGRVADFGRTYHRWAEQQMQIGLPNVRSGSPIGKDDGEGDSPPPP